MKWYFASNDRSEKFFPLIKAAVTSALENTTLEPIFIYDGEENELTNWLRERNVKIIPHRVSFYDKLKEVYDEAQLNIASGAFLRCDIPIIEKNEDGDNIILYTDCDVIFLKDFELPVKPDYFACSSQTSKTNFQNFNTGVMLMNVEKLKESHEEFTNFITQNIKILSAYDQTAYQIFYNSKNTKLPIEFNHKPYWGIDDNAFILHFHGPKPTLFESDEELKNLYSGYNELYKKNPKAYDFYLDLFKKYYPEINYDKLSIEKLKNSLYPLIKGRKNPVGKRIKSKLTKEFQIIKQKFKIC